MVNENDGMRSIMVSASIIFPYNSKDNSDLKTTVLSKLNNISNQGSLIDHKNVQPLKAYYVFKTRSTFV